MAEEKPPETEQAAPPAAKSGIAKLLPLIGGIVGGLALGGILGFTLLGPKLSHKNAVAPAAAEGAAGGPAGGAAAGKKESGPEAKKGDAPPAIYQIDNLVMNPAGSGGSHFLLMSVALQLKDAGSLETLKGRDAELRDGILRLFSRKTNEQISDIAARDQFSAELMGVLDRMFGTGTVVKIYFPQFVVQ